MLRIELATSVSIGEDKGSQESLKSSWEKGQAPARMVPGEAGRSEVRAGKSAVS